MVVNKYNNFSEGRGREREVGEEEEEWKTLWYPPLTWHFVLVSIFKKMREAMVLVLLAICSKAAGSGSGWWRRSETGEATGYCLSWRVAVEANNIRAWRTVPGQCLGHVETYMMGGQYERDVSVIVDSICSYIESIGVSGDGMDAWILDVDETCISNLLYYRGKRYGCEPFDPQGFKAWALSGRCDAIPDVLRLYLKLIASGFKVFLVTGRDEETLGQATALNLQSQGFFAYHRLILRSGAYKGQSATAYKSAVRKQLAEEGYRIWGNVGDQWSDLQGDYPGNRTFKLPNPMYFIP